LSARSLRQLRGRMAIRTNIRLLSRDESLAYLRHRLARATYGTSPVFTPGALNRIVRYARGNPRTLNIVCDNALIAGYAGQVRPITSGIVREVIAGMASKKKRIPLRWAAALAAALLVLLGASAAIKTVHGSWSYERTDRSDSAHVSVPVSPEAPKAGGDAEAAQPVPRGAVLAETGQKETASVDMIAFPMLEGTNETKGGLAVSSP